MSDDDFVRRVDALDILTDFGLSADEAVSKLSALPAAAPKVKPLVWEDRKVGDHEIWGADIYDVWVGSDHHGIEGVGEDVRLYPTIEAAKSAAQADYEARILAALDTPAQPALAEALHRSFPEAGDGRPMPPMGDELMTAGLNAEDARFVAVQLAQNGWILTPAAPVGDMAGLVERARAGLPELSVEDREYEGDVDYGAAERLLEELANAITALVAERDDYADQIANLLPAVNREAVEQRSAREKAEAALQEAVEALRLYSCGDGCNDCPEHERNRVSCGWTARAFLAKHTKDASHE